jgi:uncharacterized protein YbaR (Trm112 family)
VKDAAAPPRDFPDAPAGQVDRRMLEFLVCPVTRGRLVYDAERQELVSKGAGLAFPIQNGVPVMLVDGARALDG